MKRPLSCPYCKHDGIARDTHRSDMVRCSRCLAVAIFTSPPGPNCPTPDGWLWIEHRPLPALDLD